MIDQLREAPLGQLIRFFSKGQYLKYPEEEPDFELPECWVNLMNEMDGTGPPRGSLLQANSDSGSTAVEEERKSRQATSGQNEATQRVDDEKTQPAGENSNGNHEGAGTSEGNSPSREQDDHGSEDELRPRLSRLDTTSYTQERLEADEQHELDKTKSIPIVPKRTADGAILVDWYYSDDPANPQNWTNSKRLGVTTIICLYTFVVYTSSAIYTSSELGVQKAFNVSSIASSLGLSLYVLGYGVGPLVFSPMSEIPLVGRNPVYVATMFLFIILTIPTAFAQNFGGLLVLRFLTGFFGSPCLASGGASLGDIYSLMSLPYAMMAWVSAAYCGPALGPLLSGFAVPAESWRWSLFESLWAAAPIALLMFICLPETSHPNILLRRAKRIRKLTGNPRFMSQSEIDQRNMKLSAVVLDAVIKPMEITFKDPAVLFVQVYTAIIYGIYYSFFEVFPLVYPPYYGFNLGQIGLVFLCILVSCMIGVAIYTAWLYFYQNPRIRKYGMPEQEMRLIPALPNSFGPTIGLFLFAWTARRSIHWIVPTIGITIYGATVFIVMQCVFVYIPLSYPMYAASLFAANDFFRSAFASGSIIFAHPLYANLGVAKGTSLLGGLSVIGIIGIWLLYYIGADLRARSKFAVSTTETF